METKMYLGDSVYVEFLKAEGMLKLYLDNGYGEHDSIFLEPEVYSNLIKFVEQLKEKE